ncbi:hypothetical protein SODALDRAFT_71232 [Sodiomyces alkalinus F11]|uniref:Uncharacterized protein n=1 Tax=Sodiomyces alkalinus (strain CBS 110278 / VKM F-3762 / F11) TaxID=1314773 RepID=A0A3N2PMI1_SODAK|nr:hypothetical protein SODALDRAFT_71232 [Sodiomyces alkalinus F11]ROT35630.1 hypothetical protein SODALDRAFT_71232 [Sodiomyces alkalinus F11]
MGQQNNSNTMQEPNQKSLPRQSALHCTRSRKATVSASINTSLLRCHATLQLARSSSVSSPSVTPLPPSGLAGTSASEDQDRRDIHLSALCHADDALATALAFNLHQARARAYLFRGHSLVRLGEWERAHGAYVRAASVMGPGWRDADIEGLTRRCLCEMGCIPQEVGPNDVRGRRGRRAAGKPTLPGETCIGPSCQGGSEGNNRQGDKGTTRDATKGDGGRRARGKVRLDSGESMPELWLFHGSAHHGDKELRKSRGEQHRKINRGTCCDRDELRPHANLRKDIALNEDGEFLVRLQDGTVVAVSRKRPILRRVTAMREMHQKTRVPRQREIQGETENSSHDALCLGVWAAVKRRPPKRVPI